MKFKEARLPLASWLGAMPPTELYWLSSWRVAAEDALHEIEYLSVELVAGPLMLAGADGTSVMTAVTTAVRLPAASRV